MNQFERHVKKGEQHAYYHHRAHAVQEKDRVNRRDLDTSPHPDAEGKAVMEEREVEIPMFRPVKVFDGL